MAGTRSKDPAAIREQVQNSRGQKLLRAARLFNGAALSELQSRGHSLRESHTRLLPHFDLDGTNLTDLARRAGITKQSAQRLVDDMVEAGYLSREPDPDDRRAKRIVPTRKGLRGFGDGLSSLAKIELAVEERVGPRGMKAFERTLDEIVALLEGEQ